MNKQIISTAMQINKVRHSFQPVFLSFCGFTNKINDC